MNTKSGAVSSGKRKAARNRMESSFKATPFGLAEEAWFYVGRNSISVFVRPYGVDAGCARLTRLQLMAALKLMEDAK